MKIVLPFVFPLLLILSAFACKKPTEVSLIKWPEFEHPSLEAAHLQDSIPKKYLVSIRLKETKGIKSTYVSGKHTSYFEYEADADKILTLVSSLPFKRTDTPCDTLCRNMQTNFSLSGKKFLSKEEVYQSEFFWNINPQDYIYYECIKAPDRHTILINKKNNQILHRIETTT